jgi:hypothetical protein
MAKPTWGTCVQVGDCARRCVVLLLARYATKNFGATQMTKQEIIQQLDNWNNTTNGADARNALRRAVGWQRGSSASFGAKLIDMLEANGNYTPHTLTQSSKVENALTMIEGMMFGRVMVYKVAKLLLHSNWDFVDPIGAMHKEPDEVEDFLESCSMEVTKYDDMHPSRRSLFKMICDAYMRSLR